MDEIYTKIQVYLMKKDKECEKLRFLTSKTTPSNEAHVTDVCNAVKTILEESAIEKKPNENDSIQHFKFLLLNTNFRAQEYLCEDIANGHLVDMCPPLSPYLFIEILWALNYDDILCNSILYLPMDLGSEILDIMRRCLDLDFQRAFDVVLRLIANCYKKLVSTIGLDAQVLDESETVKRFFGSVQELIALIPDLQYKETDNFSQLMKYKRRGLVLIRILDMVKDCVALRRAENVSGILDKDMEKLYRVTFGRNFMARLDPDLVTETIDSIFKELIDVLLANVKKIDCYVYMGWAELDYAEDTSMTMQRAVGLACYHFTEFLGEDKRNEEYIHVVECLEQISSKPDAPFAMSLRELCTEIEKGNRECLRKLIQRFEEWDSASILCLDENRAFVDRDECSSLLDSAVKFLEISDQEKLRTEVYGLVMKILLGQKLIDTIEIVVEFILMHDASRVLESTNFEQDLKSYVNQGLALCSSKTSLRIVLFFVIQNPREVLKTLIKAAIGYAEYTNGVMLPEDFCKLSPILQIRDFNNLSLLSNSLRAICLENIAWNSKKFVDLIQVLLDKNLLSSDDLLNDIFIPVLKNDVILSNIQSILTSMRFTNADLTAKVDMHELLYVLALQMAKFRNNARHSMYARDEMLNLLIRIVRLFANNRINSPVENRTVSFVQKLEASLEPIDKMYFASQQGCIKDEISLDQVLDDYKKRCFYIMNESKDVKTRCADLGQFLEAHGLETSDFLQHLILRSTEFEYLRFSKEALLVHWNYFGWENELDAYAQFSLATVKACNNSLTSFASINSWEFSAQKFASLIKNLAKLTTWFISIDVMTDYESVYKSLFTAMSALNLPATVSPDLSHAYKEFQAIFDRSTGSVDSYKIIAELVHNVDKFADQYLSQRSQPVANKVVGTLSAQQFYLNSKFITMCTNWPMGENSLLLSKIDKKLYPKCQDGDQTGINI